MQRGKSTPQVVEGAARSHIAWFLTSIVLGIDLCWLLLGGWSVPLRGLVPIAAVVVGGLALLSIGRYRRDPRIRTTVLAALLLIVFTAAAGTLSYLVVSTDAQLVDARLAVWDSALGFDWLALSAWLQLHPVTAAILRLAYFSGLLQMAAVVMVLGFTARRDTLDEFLRVFIAATLVTIVLSGAFPAAGTWKHYGMTTGYDLASLSHFELLRNGQMRVIPLDSMQGLISIPSMHSAMAVLLVYAVREVRWLWPPLAALNVAMLLATPVDGSHYLVDVLAGIVLAAVLVALDRRRYLAWATSRAHQPMASARVLQR